MQSPSVRNAVFSLFVSRCTVVEIEAPDAVPNGLDVRYFGG